MRPPESFSTAATNRRSHSCCVSLMVAVLSFITKLLSCASPPATTPGLSDRRRAQAPPVAKRQCVYRLSFPPCLPARTEGRRPRALAFGFVFLWGRQPEAWQGIGGVNSTKGMAGLLPQRALPRHIAAGAGAAREAQLTSRAAPSPET